MQKKKKYYTLYRVYNVKYTVYHIIFMTYSKEATE